MNLNTGTLTFAKCAGNFKCLLILGAVIASLAGPLPTDAYITFSTRQYPNSDDNPEPSKVNMEILAHAIHCLATDQRLSNHPIRRYLNDPDIKAHIIFDNPHLNSRGIYASVKGNHLVMLSDKALDHYLTILIHEFIHIDIAENYLLSMDYSFLHPEDWAFQNLMEEVFGVSLALWVYLAYQEIENDPHVRNWEQHSLIRVTAEAMRNDFAANYPDMDAEEINAKVALEMFFMLLTRGNTFSLRTIPHIMAERYGKGNIFLISEYTAYRDRGDALLRHQWNRLVSMMPFSFPENYTYGYFRSRFRKDYTRWAASSPENSILFWVNFPVKAHALASIACRITEDISYGYLSHEDETRLNRIMQEIDPQFIPVSAAAAFPLSTLNKTEIY